MQERLVDYVYSTNLTISREQILQSVRGTFIVQNRITEADNNNHAAESHSVITIREITGGILLDFLEGIQQSNREINIEEISYTFMITISSTEYGGSAIKIPKWAVTKDVKESFKIQTFNGHPVNCGAFCIAQIIKPPRQRLSVTIKTAYLLQRHKQWGKLVTKFDVAQALFERKPNCRLTFLRENQDCQALDTYYGPEWEEVRIPRQRKFENCYYIYWSLNQHFGLCSSPREMFRAHISGREFCHLCVTQYPHTNKCRCEEPVLHAPPKRKKCTECNIINCEGCTKNCQHCDVKYKDIFKNNGEGEIHRCMLMNNSPIKKFLMPDEEPTERKPKFKLYAYDLESRVKTIEGARGIKFRTTNNEFVDATVKTYEFITQHVPNLVVFRDVFDPDSEQIYFGDDCLERFLEFMTRANKGRNICIAHNGSGYDSRLLFDTIINRFGKVVDKEVKFICRGTKFMKLKWGPTLFLDSLLHLPGSLANLAKSFNLTTRKGYFPHLFNTVENYSYNDTLPEKKYFDLTFIAKSRKDIDEFNRWHDQRTNEGLWNFKDELIAYCRDDVKILAEIMKQFHDTCISEFDGESPWFSTTAPSFCHKTVLRNITQKLTLPKDKEQKFHMVNHLAMNLMWGVQTSEEYWFERLALRGGRTDVRKIFCKLTPEQIARGCKIVYVDIVSMYPFVQVARDYPRGLPTIYVYDEEYYPCKKHCTPKIGNVAALKCRCAISRKKRKKHFLIKVIEETEPDVYELINRPEFFGYICAHLIPPSNLYHPVLVTWDEEAQKCTAKLEEIKEGVFTTPEFKVAIEKGYRCVKIFRYHQYSKGDGLWNDFIKDLYIKKMASSGPAPTSPEERNRIVDSYSQLFGSEYGEKIRASFDSWSLKPAARQVYKIMLNSVWGKHCQRPVMPKSQVIHKDDNQQWYNIYANIEEGNLAVTKFLSFEDRTLLNTTRSDQQKTRLDFHDCYLPAGAFVPAYGRLMLFEQLDKLGKRVLYHDTDSIIYVYDPAEYNIPTNDIWGTWEEEKISKEGITEFISTGPKSYAIKTRNSEIVKLKGVALKHSHRFLVNFDSMKQLIFDTLEGLNPHIEIPQYKFNYKMGRGMHNEEFYKHFKFHSTDLKGDLKEDLCVYPKGYRE